MTIRRTTKTQSDKRLSYASYLLAALLIGHPQTGFADTAFQKTFAKSDQQSQIVVDHKEWDELLKKYVKPGPNGLNHVDYKNFKQQGQKPLKAYIARLEASDPTILNRPAQFAFWANLYNAKTIDIVLTHYPVKSIRDIDISPGLFADGPWKKKVVNVKGHDLSLDDIEHNILRVFWKDPRVHYAVNCASIGCPNLLTTAFSGPTLNKMLDAAAKAYINAPRGVSVKNGSVTLSKIYKWYAKDFGSSETDLIEHLRQYAEPRLAKSLKKLNRVDSYDYDWRLNDSGAKASQW